MATAIICPCSTGNAPWGRGKIPRMAKIPGRLLADLYPNCTVRVVFIATVGGGNESPFAAKSLDAAETIFMTCGLAPERAAALRAELERNKVVSVETTVDEAVAERVRFRKTVA